MKKKRSIWILLLATSFIAVCAYPLLKTKFSLKLSFYPHLDFAILSFRVLYNITGIFIAINIFRLKEWSRRLIAILSIIGVVSTLVFIPLSHWLAEKYALQAKQNPEKLAEQLYEQLPQRVISKMNISKSEFIKRSAQRVNNSDYMEKFLERKHRKINVTGGLYLLYMSIIVFSFTRPQVKAQFKPGGPNA